MRRPLFTTGRPQIVSGVFPILDLRSLNTELQSFTRFVTLYAAGQGLSSDMIVSLQEGTNTPIRVNSLTLAATMAGGPVKVLDRFPLRGNAQIFVQGSNAPVVWGYFELDGSINVDVTDRPLQPGNLVSPFTYLPISVVTGAPEATLHSFVTGYYDIVNLDVYNDVAEGTVSSLLVSDGEVSTAIEFNVGLELVKVFDGIPMMGASNNDPRISLFSLTSALAGASGSFIRVS